MTEHPLIQTRELSIAFGGNWAVNRVDLDLWPYTLKSIIGPNGAGKTTFFNLVSGQYKPSTGHILFKGRDISRLGAADRTRLGIGRSFQLTNIFPNLSVLENVRLALQSKEKLGWIFWRDVRVYSELEDRAYEFLQEVLLEKRWQEEAINLSHGEQRKLEIAILLALDPELLLLDEPTAGMSQEEVPAILEIIQRIKSAKERTLLLVEHKFDMIMSLSDSIAVLKDGGLLCDDVPEAVVQNQEVQAAYLGGGVTHD